MSNKYELTEEITSKFTPILKDFIAHMETYEDSEGNFDEEKFNNAENSDFNLVLTDTGINPYQLKTLLEMEGYECENIDNNGWQGDFWLTMVNNEKGEAARELQIWGTALTFEVTLSHTEFM